MPDGFPTSKRSALTGFTAPIPGETIYGFVIVNDEGLPKGGDGVVACFSNCGRYEFPTVPSPNCSDTDPTCHLWKTFCLNAPASAYGKSCTKNADCIHDGIHYGIACWNNGTTTTCQGRGFHQKRKLRSKGLYLSVRLSGKQGLAASTRSLRQRHQ